MPNHVFAHISVEKKYADKLREISKVGLCRHYQPMPEELELFKWYKKSNPDHQYGEANWFTFQKEQKEWIEKQKKFNLAQHGAEDWYAWAINNWGTKWGCYETHFNEDDNGAYYSFSTAWSPIDYSIMYELLKDIPDLDYEWEEEQGYGEMHEYKEGQCVSLEEWDMPEWSSERWNEDRRSEDVETYGYTELSLLTKPITKWGTTYKRGYYLDFDFEEYLGTNYERAVEKVAQRRKELNKLKLHREQMAQRQKDLDELSKQKDKSTS